MKLLWLLFTSFFRIGLFSIGGGYAIIPLIQEQVVERSAWIDQKTFTDIITISQMTPGPLAVNTSTFVGLQIAGPAGAVLATLGCVAAGICFSLLLYRFFGRHSDSACIPYLLSGLKAVSLGLIISAAATILLSTFTGTAGLPAGGPVTVDFRAALLFAVSLTLLLRFKGRLNPVLLMLAAGAAGIILYH